METETHSLLDRVAIGFGAMVLGCGAGLVVGLPLLFIVGAFTSDASSTGALVFWKVPILLGLVSGVVGFISPRFSADWLGNLWKGVVNVWRGFGGV
jgi:hypothetical protein